MDEHERAAAETIARLANGRAIDVRFTANRSTMVSVSERGGRLRLRLQRVFAAAPEAVLLAVVRAFVFRSGRHKRAARAAVSRFLAEREEEIRANAARPERPPELHGTAGEHHDLAPLWEKVNAEEFGGELAVAVSWSARVARRQQGNWALAPEGCPNVLYVNRLLDDASVPVWYLEYVLFHEGLHELIHLRTGERHGHRGPFAERERAYAGYVDAQIWERENLERLWRRHRRREAKRRRETGQVGQGALNR